MDLRTVNNLPAATHNEQELGLWRSIRRYRKKLGAPRWKVVISRGFSPALGIWQGKLVVTPRVKYSIDIGRDCYLRSQP